MPKDRNDPLRRTGRSRLANRVRRGRIEQLQRVWSEDGGAVHAPERHTKAPSVRRALSERNWRVKRLHPREVVAIEPGGDYETPFGGPEAFWDAVQFAARELKKEPGCQAP